MFIMVSIGLNDDPSSTLTLFGRKVYLVFISKPELGLRLLHQSGSHVMKFVHMALSSDLSKYISWPCNR